MTQTKSYRERQTQKRRYWRKHIKAWKASGLTQAQYCRKFHLKVHCLLYWRKKFSGQDNLPASIVELKLPECAQSIPPSGLTLAVRSYRIEVGTGFDPSTLKLLIHTLELP